MTGFRLWPELRSLVLDDPGGVFKEFIVSLIVAICLALILSYEDRNG